MKIAASHLALESSHTALTRQESSETLRVWRGERPDFERTPSAIARISDAARQALAASPTAAVPPAPTSQGAAAEAQEIAAAQADTDYDPFVAMVRRMLEFLTGREVKVFDMQDFSAELRQAETQASATVAAGQAGNSGRVGWGLEYDYHAVNEEFEQTTFSASGVIRTADGQEIRFTLDLQMTRYYREESNVSIRAGDAVRKDPLVVNFGGTAAELASQAGRTFRFDLDGDGEAETLPLFASGSGYLALDANGNGRIDSGRELFGPRTGQGFAELALLDSDGNGWIDENDAAFKKLAVWMPEPEGTGTLRSLADLEIGALALAHVVTPFALRGADNRDLGRVKASGLYLDQSGRAGSLQEIDLTI